HVTANVTRDGAGRRTGVAGTLSDVTAQHGLETMAMVMSNLDARMVTGEDPAGVLDDVAEVMTSSTLAGAVGIALRGEDGRWSLLGHSGPGREEIARLVTSPGGPERAM